MNWYKRKHWCEWQDFPHEIVKGPIGIEYELFMRVSFDNQRRMDVYLFIISMKYLYKKKKYLNLILPEYICYKMKETSPTLSMTNTDDQIGIFTRIYEIHSVYDVLKETNYFIIFAKGL